MIGRASGASFALLASALLGVGTAGVAQVPGTSLPTLPVSVRQAGMAGASVSLLGHAATVLTNPAGLPAVRTASAEGAYARLSETGHYLMGAVAGRWGSIAVGGGVRYIRFDEGGPVARNFESVVGIASHVRGVAFGVAANYHSVRDEDEAMTRLLTADAALTVAFFDIAALALVAQNVGSATLEGEGLTVPSTLHLGFSLNLIDTYSNGRLLATIEQVWGDGDETFAGEGLRFGLEAGAVFRGVGLVGRAALGPRPGETPFSNPRWGGSLVFGRSALDYSYLHRPERGGIHLFGWRLTL